MKLDAFVDAYLLVARAVDPEVLAHQQRTIDAATEYNRLNQNRAEVQLIFAALYAVGVARHSVGRDLGRVVGGRRDWCGRSPT